MRASLRRRILIVDDEPQILTFLRDLFQSHGWDVYDASCGTEGIEKLERERYDVVLTDLKMPGADGIEVLRTVKKIQSDAEVVLMTAYGTVDSAIEAMRAGAFHFLMKPFRSEEVIHLVEKAYGHRQLKRENLFLKAEVRGRHQLQAVVGTSGAIQEVIAQVQRLADTDTPVLIEGERGTGRGFFARVIHFNSSRAGGLFVPAVCAGVREDLLESNLFGHAAGAYRQATLPRAGKIELANHGTIYLADIDKAGAGIQERILRLLTRKTISPVGSGQEIEVDVRLVASTQSDPGKPALSDKFPGALRDALEPGTIRLSPLRKSSEDIPLLLHHFLFEANRDRKKPLRGFSEAAVSALAAYTWPGNVRELTELVRAISSRKKQGTVVDAADLPTEILYGRKRRGASDQPSAAKQDTDIRDAIESLEKPMVLQALALAEGDKEKAAELLHIDVAALVELIRQHGIE
ncbi:MAG: sigma-54-dependent Fis family transcriptional regulator [Deltaproteobacteria bacterium]|nr:sigma-54-dependent Fis family transcriptional regulator [Deltaproteobacteria bacterium]